MILNTIFFGSSNYCLPILDLLRNNFHLLAVITKPDKPTGRKQILTPSAVKKYALSHNIQVFTPSDRDELLLLRKSIPDHSPDLAVVADYGIIIPKTIINLPKYKTINIHFSRLPRLRGAAPVQHTILLGEKSAWISIFLMEEKLDTGDILWQKELKLEGVETSDFLYHRLFDIAADNLPEIIDKCAQGKIKPVKQDHSKATYTKRLTKEDGFIPFPFFKLALEGGKPTEAQLYSWLLYNSLISKHHTDCATLIERAVRAFSPWPGVWTIIKLKTQMSKVKSEEKRLKILKAHIEPAARLVPDLVQLEGKNPVSWKQFLTAYPGLFQN